jgi:hypothetical protein
MAEAAEAPIAEVKVEALPPTPPSPPNENTKTKEGKENENKYNAIRGKFQSYFDEIRLSENKISENDEDMLRKDRRLYEADDLLNNTRQIVDSVETRDPTVDELSSYLRQTQIKAQEQSENLRMTMSSQAVRETKNLIAKARGEWVDQGGEINKLIEDLKKIEEIKDPQLKAEKIANIHAQISGLARPIEEEANTASMDLAKSNDPNIGGALISGINGSLELTERARMALGDKYYQVLSKIGEVADLTPQPYLIEEAITLNRLNYQTIVLAANSLGRDVAGMIDAIINNH